MNIEAIAFHEVGHAFAGLSCGRWGQLSLISIIPNDENLAECVWVDRGGGLAPKNERNGEIAFGLSGPITQIWYVPESAGSHLNSLSRSVVCHPGFYEIPLFTGWWKDVMICAEMHAQNLPKSMRTPWEDIEEKFRDLLRRATVDAAIREVAAALLVSLQLNGKEAEAMFRSHLTPEDTPGYEYYT